MIRAVAWWKSHQYQWEREDFRKAFDKLYYAFLITVGVLVCTVMSIRFLGITGDIAAVVVILCFLLIVMIPTSILTINWADKRLKKER